MGSLRLLLNRGILFLGVVILTINKNSKSNLINEGHHRLPYNIIPLHYDINLELFDTDDIFIDGECNITIQINQPTQSIRFHADLSQITDLVIQLSKWSPRLHTLVLEVYKPINSSYVDEYHIFTSLYNAEIPPGIYVMHMTFRNKEVRNEGSLFRTSYINEVGDRTWLVATDFQTIGARKLFPCWDDPAFRATFNISIKHYVNYIVLSNMPVQEIRRTEQSNMMWTVFKKTPQIPTYHVSAILLTMSFSVVDEVIIQYKSQLNDRYIEFIHNVIKQVTKHLKSQAKCFENFTQVTHVAIPGFSHDAVTNLGLIYYRETAIIYDEEKDSIIRRTKIVRLIGRAVAYQCLGTTIPSWWSYMWLNEGIAMLLGMDAIDEAYPDFHMKDYFVVQILQESLRFDTDSVMKPLISEVNDPSDIDSIFSISYYIKAPVIMRMLQQILTNNVFRKGINMYLNKEVSLLETILDVFWAAMQTAYNEAAYNETRKYNEEKLNIKQVMDVWTKQQHYPILKVERTESFIIAFVQSMNARENNWWIPYSIATQINPDFFLSNRSQQLKMQNPFAEKDFSYDIAHDKWIIFNVQQIGYYRVNYDAKGWQNIVRYLNSEEYDKIHVVNRAQIIDDAFYFLMEGQLDLSTFLELAKYLSQERDFIAWYPMFKAFEYMSSFFPLSESSYIKNTMIEILDVLLKEIGYEKKNVSSPINSLIEEAAKWACIFGSLKCRKEAMDKLTTDLIKEEDSSTWMKEWTLCNGLKSRNMSSWHLVLHKYMKKSDYTIFKFLTCAEPFFHFIHQIDIEIERIANMERITLSERAKDDARIHIFHSIVARHAKSDIILDYILNNFDRLKPRNISTTVALVDIINHAYSKEQLNMVTKFLENYERIRITDLLKLPLIEDRLDKKMIEVPMNNVRNLLIHETNLLIHETILLYKKKVEMRLSQIRKQRD